MINNSEKSLLNEWLILQTSGYFHRDLSSFYDLENKESIFFIKIIIIIELNLAKKVTTSCFVS